MAPTLPAPQFPLPLARVRSRSVISTWARLCFLLLLIPGMGSTAVHATTCANAIVINPASLPITNQALVCGSGDDLNDVNVPGALCGSGSTASYKRGNEALYSFTPSTTASYQLSYTGVTWCAAMVYIGCPTLNNCVYGSGNSGSAVSFAVNLNAGTTYFIWFDVWPAPYYSPCPGTFSLGPPPPPITNDNPCQATPLTVNPNLLCATQTPGSLVGATATTGVPASCGGTPNDDVWFQFTATGTTHYISLNNVTGSPTDLYHAVYRGTCGSLINVNCSDNDNSTVTGLIPGNTYWVRVYSYSSNSGANTTFNVCIGTPPPPPTNDNPCQAEPLTVNPTLVCTTQTPGSLASATPTAGVPSSCGGTPDDDVWFQFTATGTTHYISLNNVVGNETDLYHAVYSGNCNSLTNLSCSDADNSVVSGLIPGNTYWVRVYSYYSNSGATTSFNVCVGTPPPPPPPPPCGGIFYDDGGASGNYSASAGQTTTICPSTPGDMVSLVFTQFDLENNYDRLLIYDGNSTAGPLLGNFTGATLPPVLTASNPSGCLTAVFTSDGSMQYAGWAAQVLCTPIPAGDCVYVLHLHDSGGNGWGSSMVRVRINGGPWTNYTVTASDRIALIGVNIGDVIELDYVVATGPNQNQNSYSISKSGANPYFTSATPPVAGTSFIQTVTCGPPPALQQDCAGAVTVCSSQSITNNSASTGDVMDLNSSNQGCLSSEHQGTWYFFSPQTAGNIGFSIAPANGTDDYDFALWGPFTSTQCPTGPPLRCSWNAPPSYTVGLGNGANDLSEDAGGDGWVKTIDVLAGQVYVLYIDNWSTSGQAFTLTWQLSGGTSLDCTTLPVELIALEATPNDPVIDITWATATEHNSHHFTVERSPDNVTFTPIGTVAAAGNAQFRNDYLFVDQTPFRGVNYYRLEQVDIDGTTMRSHTVVATLSDGDGRPSIYPNPASDLLNVVFTKPMDKPIKLVVLDALGRTVAAVNTDAMPGQRTAQVPIEHLAPGWYSLRIDLPDGGTLNGGQFLKKQGR